MKIPMSAPDITDEEISSVVEVIKTGRLSLGPHLEEFERRFARYVGTTHAVGVSSGTAGLHLALLAYDIEPGDLVVTSPFSFVASANAILYTGAMPVFVDVDESTGNIDAGAVHDVVAVLREGRYDEHPGLATTAGERGSPIGRLRALLPVHVFGRVGDVPALARIAETENMVIVEDACEALGASRAGRAAGTFGEAAVFAFYPNKQMTTGEGGMVVTDDDRVADLCRSMRNHGRDVHDSWLQHSRLGFNYRLDEMSAALGAGQIARIDQLLRRRASVAALYMERLASLSWLSTFGEGDALSAETSWFVFVVRLADGVDRQGLLTYLEDNGIPSRAYFSPLHTQPHIARRWGYSAGDFPVAERLGRSCLALPFSGRMTEEEVDYVCRAVVAYGGAS